MEQPSSEQGPGPPATGSTDDKIRIAIVVVHGMGQHLPMQTVERVVRAAIAPRTDDDPNGIDRIPTFFSRPDRLTAQLELRRFLAPGDPHRSRVKPNKEDGNGETRSPGSVRPQTEIYEYHWAHHMAENKLSDTVPLLLRLAPTSWPIGWLRFGSYLLLAATVTLSVLAYRQIESRFDSTLVAVIAALATLRVVPWLAGAAGKLAAASFGDVARYLYPKPRNLAARRDVHQGLTLMLLQLHDSQNYDRICVVGHSLGSFVAYDAITHAWTQLGRLHGKASAETGGDGSDYPQSLRDFDAAAHRLKASAAAAGGAPPAAQLDAYRRSQHELWTAYRRLGHPWLVTDLITVGSPMTHAHWLVTRSRAGLRDKQLRRELPTCPPVGEVAPSDRPDGLDRNAEYWSSWVHRGLRVPHEAAPFAMTRWTNIWFPGPLGDWIGGPLQPNFGSGIRDIPIRKDGWLTRVPILAHSMYFRYHDHPKRLPDGAAGPVRRQVAPWPDPTLEPSLDKANQSAVFALRATLRLNEAIPPRHSVPPVDPSTDDEPRLDSGLVGARRSSGGRGSATDKPRRPTDGAGVGDRTGDAG